MDFGYFLTFALACYGGANAIVYSKLLSKPRDWISSKSNFMASLLACPLCVGFWIGILISLMRMGPFEYYTIAPFSPLMCIFDGFVGSACAWLIHLLMYDKMVGK